MPTPTQPLGITESDFIFEVLRKPPADQVHVLAGLIERSPAGSMVADIRDLLQAALQQKEKLADVTLDAPIGEMIAAAEITSPSRALAHSLLNSESFTSAVKEDEKWRETQHRIMTLRMVLIESFRGHIQDALLEGEE